MSKLQDLSIQKAAPPKDFEPEANKGNNRHHVYENAPTGPQSQRERERGLSRMLDDPSLSIV
jgi:hypothetical protein